MAVPSSGQLRLAGDIGLELGLPQIDVSLGAMSDSAGFSAPDAMSDFYGYVDAVAPSVTTTAPYGVSQYSFVSTGNVTSDGGAPITERGWYIGTNSSSPTNNTKYQYYRNSLGYMALGISALTIGTTYYIWAYAINSVGTTYGSRFTQATVPAFVPQYTSQISSMYFFGFFMMSYSVGYYDIYRQYIDPYTGGLVTYDAYNYDTDRSTTSLADVASENDFNGLIPTNARNRYAVVLRGDSMHYAQATISHYAQAPYQTLNQTFTKTAGMPGGLDQNTNVLARWFGYGNISPLNRIDIALDFDYT